MFSWRTSIKFSELSDILNSDDFLIPGFELLKQHLAKSPSHSRFSINVILNNYSVCSLKIWLHQGWILLQYVNFINTEIVLLFLKQLNIYCYACFAYLLLNPCCAKTSKVLVMNWRYIWYLLCVLLCAKHFVWIMLFKLFIRLMRKVYFMKNQGSCFIS